MALLAIAVNWYNPICYLMYYYKCSRIEMKKKWTKKMVKEYFDGSIVNLIIAFTGGKKLSPEEAEDIKN